MVYWVAFYYKLYFERQMLIPAFTCIVWSEFFRCPGSVLCAVGSSIIGIPRVPGYSACLDKALPRQEVFWQP